MNQLLGRGEIPGPSKNWLLSTVVAFLLAFAVGIGIFTYEDVEVWTPLQQWYWVQYSNTKNFPSPNANYQVLSKLDREGQHSMATDADVMPAPLQGWPPFPFELTAEARQAGAVALKVETVHYPSAQMNQMLAQLIYAGQTPGDLIRPAWVGALSIFVLGLVLPFPRNPPATANGGRGMQAQGPRDGHRQRIQSTERSRWN